MVKTESRLLSSGAEARIYVSGSKVLKKRLEKKYRIPEIDTSLRKSRNKREIKILQKLHEIVPVPSLHDSDDGVRSSHEIVMDFISGPKLRDVLDEENFSLHMKKLGKYIALMHDAGIIHGDLTTSNMIFSETKKEIFLIDFGLSFFSDKMEDKAVDLHLFRTSLESRHPIFAGVAFKKFISSYRKHSNTSESTLNRLNEVEERGRNKRKV